MKFAKEPIITLLIAFILTPTLLLAQQERFDALANSANFENRPTEASIKLLMDELAFQRACQTYLWAMPLINTMGMKVGSDQGPVIRGQNFMGDIGFFGPDQGWGGKFLLLPPGYEGVVPEGYFPYRSQTNNVFIFLRGFYQDPNDLAPAVSLLEKSRVYPLGKEGSAKAMVFPDASGAAANMLPRKNASAFDQLKQLVDSETPGLADPD